MTSSPDLQYWLLIRDLQIKSNANPLICKFLFVSVFISYKKLGSTNFYLYIQLTTSFLTPTLKNIGRENEN